MSASRTALVATALTAALAVQLRALPALRAAGSGDEAAASPAADKVGRRRAGRIERVDHQPADMVVVPGGVFQMGPSESELESLPKDCQRELGAAGHQCLEDFNLKLTAREVQVDRFAIDRHEVTAEAYRQCVAAGVCSVAALVAGDERFVRSDWPMVNVTWRDAATYCAWTGKRLPTEAEWEKAARGTEGYHWPWGNQVRADGANHGQSESPAIQHTRWLNQNLSPLQMPAEFAPDDADGHAYLAPPGSLRWGESPYGVQDMAGNAAEWVQDYFSLDGYDGLPQSNPVRDVPDDRSQGLRVIRGGSWAEPRFFGLTYYRRVAAPNQRASSIGFRCARSLD